MKTMKNTVAFVALACLFTALLAAGCGAPAEGPEALLAEAIEAYGGEVFERSEVTFDFRNARFRVVRDGGRFVYERDYVDAEGHRVQEGMSNDSTWKVVDGAPVALTPEERASVETSVNSVVYFGFLPFRLDDPAVIARDLGAGELEGRAYRRIEVTFQQEGGGQDWDDRFVYWIDPDALTLDYLAYRYHRDGGGTRFRRAVNRREVGGIMVQDYENFAPLVEVRDIAEFDRLYEEGHLNLVSMIKLERVEIRPVR
jgi:hypothetical protein